MGILETRVMSGGEGNREKYSHGKPGRRQCTQRSVAEKVGARKTGRLTPQLEVCVAKDGAHRSPRQWSSYSRKRAPANDLYDFEGISGHHAGEKHNTKYGGARRDCQKQILLGVEAARPGEKEELLTWAMVILPLAGVSIDLEFTLVVEALGRNLINSIVRGPKGQ